MIIEDQLLVINMTGSWEEYQVTNTACCDNEFRRKSS